MVFLNHYSPCPSLALISVRSTSSPAAFTVPVLFRSIPSASCLVYYIKSSRVARRRLRLSQANVSSGRYIKTKIPSWRRNKKLQDRRGPHQNDSNLTSSQEVQETVSTKITSKEPSGKQTDEEKEAITPPQEQTEEIKTTQLSLTQSGSVGWKSA